MGTVKTITYEEYIIDRYAKITAALAESAEKIMDVYARGNVDVPSDELERFLMIRKRLRRKIPGANTSEFFVRGSDEKSERLECYAREILTTNHDIEWGEPPEDADEYDGSGENGNGASIEARLIATTVKIVDHARRYYVDVVIGAAWKTGVQIKPDLATKISKDAASEISAVLLPLSETFHIKGSDGKAGDYHSKLMVDKVNCITADLRSAAPAREKPCYCYDLDDGDDWNNDAGESGIGGEC